MKEKLIARALKKISKEEQKMLDAKKETIIDEKLAPIKEKISEKIPSKAIEMTEAAFAKGFSVVFEKGDVMIERTFDSNQHQAIHHGYQTMLDSGEIKASLKGIEKSVRSATRTNKILTTAEGGLLGLLGVGLPDIPLYIGVLLKTVYEIALSYGFDYHSSAERAFILQLIGMAASDDDKKEIYSKRADNVGRAIDEQRITEFDLMPVIETISQLLALRLLSAKFIQGLPIVGVVGAVGNYQFLNHLSKIAHLKYKKRFLLLNHD